MKENYLNSRFVLSLCLAFLLGGLATVGLERLLTSGTDMPKSVRIGALVNGENHLRWVPGVRWKEVQLLVACKSGEEGGIASLKGKVTFSRCAQIATHCTTVERSRLRPCGLGKCSSFP